MVPPPKKNTFLCKLASKCKMTCHARDMSTKDDSSPLSFGPHFPQKATDHNAKVKIKILVQSSSYAHSKALDQKNRSVIFTMLYYHILESKAKEQNGHTSLPVYSEYFQKY